MGSRRRHGLKGKIREVWRVGVRAVLNSWSNHPSLDSLLVSVALGGHLLVVYRWDKGNVLAWAESSQRVAIYAAGAGVAALIAGFTGTTIAQYGSSTGPLVRELRMKFGDEIRRNWVNIVKWLLISALLCILAMALDSKNSPKGSEWVFESAILVSATKFGRLLFLFNLLLTALDEDLRTPVRSRAPELTLAGKG